MPAVVSNVQNVIRWRVGVEALSPHSRFRKNHVHSPLAIRSEVEDGNRVIARLTLVDGAPAIDDDDAFSGAVGDPHVVTFQATRVSLEISPEPNESAQSVIE